MLRLASASSPALTHPHSDPAIPATATNERVKRGVDLGILAPTLFMARQGDETVYMLSVRTYPRQSLIVVAVPKPTSCPAKP